jgi:hypothetical protein
VRARRAGELRNRSVHILVIVGASMVCRGGTPATAGGAAGAPGPQPGVVLYEVHTITGWPEADTVVTAITPGRVRVSHRLGEAILDVPGDRLVLMDRATRSFSSMSLRDWEARIAAALAASQEQRQTAPDSAVARYELEGDGGEIAGFRCQRWHLFTRRELFPGETDLVEQEIWVSRELELPGAAYETYRRALEGLDRLGLDPSIRRPPGVALRLHTRAFAEPGGAGSEEIERSEVVRVERRPLEPSWFDIPAGYVPADSGAASR